MLYSGCPEDDDVRSGHIFLKFVQNCMENGKQDIVYFLINIMYYLLQSKILSFYQYV